MITAAVVVAGASTAADAEQFLAAISSATDAPVDLIPVVDAPGAVVLHQLPHGAAHGADAVTLVLFCGHVVRDHDGRLFFMSRADEVPSLRTGVPIDAIRDVIRASGHPIVVVFDCTIADDDRTSTTGERLAALEQSLAGLAVGVLVSNARRLGLRGGLTRALAEGIANRHGDLDGDGVITVDELFPYARRRVEQAGLAPHCIAASTRAGRMALIRYRDRNVFEDDVRFTLRRPRAVQPGVVYRMVVVAHRPDATSVKVPSGADIPSPVGRGSILRFVPYVEGISFDPPEQPFR